MSTQKVKPLRVAAVQMTSTEDWQKNLEKSLRWIEKAADQGAKLICFPENFLLLSEHRSQLESFSKDYLSKALEALKAKSRNHSIGILAGSLPVHSSSSQKLLNQSQLIDTQGNVIANYSKIHLFDIQLVGDRSYRESDTYARGHRVVCPSFQGVSMGLSICYDLRFPELYRKLSVKGAQVLLIPSAFTVPTGKAHWEVLTRARAIENQCFVIAPAQVGKNTNRRKTFGHTCLIDPWGSVMAEKKTSEGLIIADLKLSQLAKIRKTLPALKHRLLK